MFPYWLLFGFSAFGSIEYRRRAITAAQPQPLFLFAAAVTALMIGLRDRVGGDWINYIDIFELIRNMSFSEALADPLGRSDPGYSLVNWIALQLGLGIWFVNLICAIIFTWGCFKFARSQPNPWLALVVAVPCLIIVVAMGYTRQAVAIGFVMAGLATFGRQSLLRFSIYILLAALFHKSAVIVLPFVALAGTRNKLIVFAWMIFLAAALYYTVVQAAFDRLVTNYVDAQYQSQGALIRVLMNFVPACIFLRYRHRFGLSDEERKLWSSFSIAAILCLVALFVTSSSTAIDRLALYLIPIQMFVMARIPEVFSVPGRRNDQLVMGVLIYSAAIQFVWLNYADNAWAWLPYRLSIHAGDPVEEEGA